MDGNHMKDIVMINKKESKHYYYFNKINGLSIRAEYPDENEPFWAVEGPELFDISITNFCDKGCDFCYRDSNPDGHHMDVDDYREILNQLVDMHTFQVALGGGNPNQHPDFVEILRMTREDFGIVPSYTTNGRGLTNEVIRASKKYCGAVAVSFYHPIKDFISAVNTLISNDIKTNIHFLLTSKTIHSAIDLLKNIPDYLDGINAIIFLNYKPAGSRANDTLLLKNSKDIDDFFKCVSEHDMRRFKIGFDSCNISGIVQHIKYNPRFIESCEASRFSAFISEDMLLYPCSFMEAITDGINIGEQSIVSAWQKDQGFVNMRNVISNRKCPLQCKKYSDCYGGCPVFSEVNYCSYFKK